MLDQFEETALISIRRLSVLPPEKAGKSIRRIPAEPPLSVRTTVAGQLPRASAVALVDQLKEGGRMIIPVGTGFDQELCLPEKSLESGKERGVAGAVVPMTREKAKN